MIKLVLVNLIFALLLAVFVITSQSNEAWLALITSWCLAEAWLSKDKSILWWQWLLLFICLGALDVFVVLYAQALG